MYRTATVDVDGGPRLVCFCPPELAIHPGDQCIIEVDRIQEFGRALCLNEVDDDPAKASQLPRVLRCATLQDQAEAKDIALHGRLAVGQCQAVAEKMALRIRLVKVRYSFDHKVLIVVFASRDRIDFRSMAGELAGTFGCRVELKQIGVRDEAGIIGGLGICGRPLCCSTWITHFRPVNVRMARTQNCSVNPTAISGMCGRLKCCLRYEYEQYREMLPMVPQEGSVVRCPGGEEGLVIGCDILGLRVKVRLPDDRVAQYPASDVVRVRGDQDGRSHDEGAGAERAEPEPAGDARARGVRPADAGTDDDEVEGEGEDAWAEGDGAPEQP